MEVVMLARVLLLSLVSCSLAQDFDYVAEPAYSTSAPDECNYPDIDFFSDRIVDHLQAVVPEDYAVPDDNKGRFISRQATVRHLNTFYRDGASVFECTDTGLTIKVPLKFTQPLSSTFEVSPNWKLKTWLPVVGSIKTMEIEAVFDVVFVGEPSVHVTSLRVTNSKDVELGLQGTNWAAKTFRRFTSLIANEFTTRIKNFVEVNLSEMLENAMIKVPLKSLGFE